MPQFIVNRSCLAAESMGFGRSIFRTIKWLLPPAALVFIPKCPLCIVAYVAAFTGLGLSVSAAAGIRYTLIAAVVTIVILMFIRFFKRQTKLGFSPYFLKKDRELPRSGPRCCAKWDDSYI